MKNKDSQFNVCVCVCVCVCDQLCNKILNAEFKRGKYFVDEVKTLIKRKSTLGSQTQEIHYSKDKSSYKALVLTYL
jgi:hypothetical protein